MGACFLCLAIVDAIMNLTVDAGRFTCMANWVAGG
jgi:hypothetical protein